MFKKFSSLIVTSFLLSALTVPVFAHDLLPELVIEFVNENPELSVEDLEQFIVEHESNTELGFLEIQLVTQESTNTEVLKLGFFHILGGADHVLFVLALLIGFASIGQLLKQVTAFTIGHSLTLLLAGSGLLTLSSTLVEPLIAFSIGLVAYLAVFPLPDYLKKMNQLHHATLIIFFFGLFHGLGFAGVLADISIPSSLQFIIWLFLFNIGIEIGQSFIIALLLPLFSFFKKSAYFINMQRVLAVLLIGASLFWTIERLLL
jgi:hypothetical protein